MQHELYANPSSRTRRSFPFIVVMQSDIVDTETRLVAPLGLNVPPLAGTPNRALPAVRHEGADYIVAPPHFGTLMNLHLRRPLGSLREFRDDLTRALDWIFFGI